jgi:3',5'-cyclic AMP phosphodiesterase CpdA
MIPRTPLLIGIPFLTCLIYYFYPSSTPPHQIPAYRQRLIAIGDLHGDLDHTKQVLQMTNLIDDDSQWIGGRDILVQTGDIVDRGTDALAIYRLMQDLRSQAALAGGKVISILGNHEIMNAVGDWRYSPHFRV